MYLQLKQAVWRRAAAARVAGGGARRSAHAPRPGPTCLRHTTGRAPSRRRGAAPAPAPRAAGGGPGVSWPPPVRSSLLSIPIRTARAHGTLAQRASGHGSPHTLVSSFVAAINYELFFTLICYPTLQIF